MPKVPRQWQTDALLKYDAANRQDFLLEAWPGCGKTFCALLIAKDLLDRNTVRRLVVVVPTDHLKTQWRNMAAECGVQLTATWESQLRSAEASDYDGMVVTYSQVGNFPDAFRKHCAVPTLVIFDEIHHAGHDKNWGDGLVNAFSNTARRLALSGTPFRSDNVFIPFITYENGGSKSDYCYTYENALSDGVCRTVFFPSYEGQMRWYKDGEFHDASFSEEVADNRAQERLRTALSPEGKWVQEVFQAAHTKLREVRKSDATAGGLVLAVDTPHANRLAKTMQTLTGNTPVIVHTHHDEYPLDDPSGKIETFAKSQSEWLIAVRMVSEGVDIPRLRVLVYATNIVTELFFRQAAGRIMRGSDEAYFFFPKDSRLREYAEHIKELRDHQIQEELERAQSERVESSDRLSDFQAIASTGSASDIYVDGVAFSPEIIAEVQGLINAHGGKDKFPDVLATAKMIRAARGSSSMPPAAEPVSPIEVTKKDLRKTICSVVSHLVYRNGSEFTQKDVHSRLADLHGGYLPEATVQQLEARIDTVQAWLKHGNYPESAGK
jgi:superfamily II DNA or RNA helicase